MEEEDGLERGFERRGELNRTSMEWRFNLAVFSTRSWLIQVDSRIWRETRSAGTPDREFPFYSERRRPAEIGDRLGLQRTLKLSLHHLALSEPLNCRLHESPPPVPTRPSGDNSSSPVQADKDRKATLCEEKRVVELST